MYRPMHYPNVSFNNPPSGTTGGLTGWKRKEKNMLNISPPDTSDEGGKYERSPESAHITIYR